MKLVIHPAVDNLRLEAIAAVCPGATVVNASDEVAAIAAMPGTAGVLGKITAAMLDRADELKWVQSFTASLEHYLFPGLVEHPCVLTNMRGLFGDVIADQVMGYVLCFARNLHTYIRQQLEHRYEPAGGEAARVSFASGPGTVNAMDRATIYLPETTMGIVGLGAIGAEIARRASAFGISLLAVDRFPDRVDRNIPLSVIWPIDRLPELLKNADFVVIAAPQTPETIGLFDTAAFDQMKPGSFLINIGRGPIVRLDALVAALQSNQLGGAALDVFEVEPLPSDHPLWDFPNVILTPHTAGYSTVIAARHLETLVENVRRFVNNKPLMNVVDKTLWF